MAVLLLSLPNLLCSFWPRVDAAQAESFWLGTGLILLPCVFSVTVRTALCFWVPLAALIPATMMYTLASRSPLREWAFVVLMETNGAELERFFTPAMLALVLGPAAAWGYWWFVRWQVIPSHRLGWLSRTAVVMLAGFLPVVAVCRGGWEFGGLASQRQFSATFPVGPVVAAVSAMRIRHQLEQRRHLPFDVQAARRTPASDQREIYVLVIGESARFDSFQLNGYARETTPLLCGMEGVLSFQEVIAPATVTLMSVPLLLTPARAPWLGKAAAQPSVISVFKQAGFSTAWYSTQRKHGRYDTACSIFAGDADESRFLSGSFAPGAGTYESAYDGELLPLVRDRVSHGPERQLMVLHTMGSHQHYGDRYPKEFNHFDSNRARCECSPLTGKFDEEQIRNLTNAYDNSIRYTDWLLAQLAEMLKSSGAVSAVYYIADHGQNPGTARVLPFAHGNLSLDVVKVPMIVWLSPEYRRQRPAEAKALLDHVRTPFSGDATFHTLVDMAGLETPLLDRSRSVAGEHFQVGPRMLRDLEGRLVNFDEAIQKH